MRARVVATLAAVVSAAVAVLGLEPTTHFIEYRAGAHLVSIERSPHSRVSEEFGIDVRDIVADALERSAALDRGAVKINVRWQPLGIGRGLGGPGGAWAFVPRHDPGETLPYLGEIIVHELHHAARLSRLPGKPRGATLAERMVEEGLATAFEVETFPTGRAARALGEDLPAEASIWLGVRTRLDQAPQPDDTRAIYDLGPRIVLAYLDRHPRETAASIVDIDAVELVRESAYAPRS